MAVVVPCEQQIAALQQEMEARKQGRIIVIPPPAVPFPEL